MAQDEASEGFPSGKESYNVDQAPVVARGVEFCDDGFDLGNQAGVQEVLLDQSGREEDAAFLSSLDGTGFDDQLVDDVLGSADVQDAVEDWRVGEAIAQAELEANRFCRFPWNARRDLKNPRASLAGAELVGFHTRPGSTACFGFGEVKTSSQERYPPSVTTDLKRQMTALCDDPGVRHNLIRYLTSRASKADWLPVFQEAWAALNRDRKHFSVFGVLVRDVVSDARDLEGLARDLGPKGGGQTHIELRGLYFQAGQISLGGTG